MLGYGTQPTANCESSDTDSIAPPLWRKTVRLKRIAQGYPSATSTAPFYFPAERIEMGNGVDKNDNPWLDWAAQTTANPQNTMSPKEMSFDGGFSWTIPPRA